MTDPAVATVATIAALKAQGATWAQIASAIGCPDKKAAKAKAKRLARQAQVSLLRQSAAPEARPPAGITWDEPWP